MKLGPDEIRKLFLGGLMSLIVIYGYFEFLLNPLKAKQLATRASIVELQPKIDAAQATLAKLAAAEKGEPAARLILSQVNAMIPEGSPVAWYPPRVADLFKKHGIEKVTTRLTTESGERVLPGFRWSVWGMEFPRVEFVPFGHAIAHFENAEPLIEITNFVLESNREEFEAQHAVLTVGNIVRK